MRRWAAITAIILSSGFLVGHHLTAPASIGVEKTVVQFKYNSLRFAEASAELTKSVLLIGSNDSINIQRARQNLKQCRLGYKRLEYFMEYFLKSNAVFYNGTPKPEIEEPYMEWEEPTGLQVIESLLFKDSVYKSKNELIEQCQALLSSARDINGMVHEFKATDEQLLESVRLELIRIFTTGITGFDAPLLKSGIEETAEVLVVLDSAMTPYFEKRLEGSDSLKHYLRLAQLYAKNSSDFDSFDRLTFLTRYGLPLQESLSKFIRNAHLELNTTSGLLNYQAKNIFSPDALLIEAFPHDSFKSSPAIVRLGEQLFNDKALSGNNRVSCATCHQPEKYFSDGLAKSVAFNGHSSVRRNAPSLFYAGFQFLQFWEGRALTLEQQIGIVLADSTEMNAGKSLGISQLEIQRYALLFHDAYAEADVSLSENDKIARAIAAYVRTLNPRNSAFDKYIQGDYRALDESQRKGFNLFMGKAQCATCHFAPLFNGLVPPYFDRTELEVLGTPATEDLDFPVEDKDPGRQEVFAIKFYKQAFKTPTVRNTAATAPYMHNGAFKSLEKVIEFYNKGGGRGIGLKTEQQTLSDLPLNLTLEETSQIVRFLQSLDDEPLIRK